MNRETHVDDLELAAFVDGGLDGHRRREVEAHLLGCDDCRRLVAGAGSLLAAARPGSRRPVLWLGGLAAAAAVVALTLVTRPDVSESGARTRDLEAVGPAGVGFAPAAPPDGARLHRDSLSFHWTGAGEGATYRITVSTDAGAIVWTEGSIDTSVVLPPDIASRLEPGRPYYWQVDAVLPDLRSASTGPLRFTTVTQ